MSRRRRRRRPGADLIDRPRHVVSVARFPVMTAADDVDGAISVSSIPHLRVARPTDREQTAFDLHGDRLVLQRASWPS
jgi:hypothetical protein